MAHTQKPDFVFRQNGRVHMTWLGARVQLTTGPEVRVSAGSIFYCAGEAVFHGLARLSGYPLHFSLALSLLPRVAVCYVILIVLYLPLQSRLCCVMYLSDGLFCHGTCIHTLHFVDMRIDDCTAWSMSLSIQCM